MNISLNLRIVFFILISIITLMTIFSSFFFFDLGGAIEVTVKENYQSIIAGNNMKKLLNQINEQLLLSLALDKDFQLELVKLSNQFDIELEKVQGNITIDREEIVINDILQQYQQYQIKIDEFISSREKEQKNRLFTEQLQIQFWSIKSTIESLIKLNESSMLNANQKARTLAGNYSLFMILIGMTGIMLNLQFIRKLSASFLSPLKEISEMARRISHWDFSLRLPQKRDDEFGRLAIEINLLLDRLEMTHQDINSYAASQRQLASSLLENYSQPVLVLDNVGEVSGANSSARLIFASEDGNEALLAMKQAIDDQKPEFSYQKSSCEIESKKLYTASGRIIGKLVKLTLRTS